MINIMVNMYHLLIGKTVSQLGEEVSELTEQWNKVREERRRLREEQRREEVEAEQKARTFMDFLGFHMVLQGFTMVLAWSCHGFTMVLQGFPWFYMV